MENKKWIGVILVLLIAGVVIAYFVAKSPNNIVTQTPSAQIDQGTNQIPARGSVQTQAQCAADGKVFFRTHWADSEQSGPSSWTYDGPEYHSNQKLKTCLVYVGETSPLDNNTSSTFNDSSATEIYTSQSRPILQSSTDRTCPPGGQCTETPGDPITFSSDIPNLSTNDFVKQKDILFNQ